MGSAMLPQGDGPHAGYLGAGRLAVKQGLDENSWRAGRSADDVAKILGIFLKHPALRGVFVEKLQRVINVFRRQTEYCFIGSSLLVCYDHGKDATSLEMRLIDFGHATSGQNQIDEGVLKGLLSLEEIVSTLPIAST